MNYENVALRQERARIVAQMQTLADKGKLTPDESAKYGRMDAEQNRLKEQYERMERSSALNADMSRTGAPPNGQPGADGIYGDRAEEDRAYKRAWKDYMIHGRSDMSAESRSIVRFDTAANWGMSTRDMGEGNPTGAGIVSSGAGVLVPVGYMYEIDRAMKYYGPMLRDEVVRLVKTDTGAPLPWPTSTDVSNVCELVGEGQQVTTQDVTIGSVQFGAYKFSSKLVKISLELLEDSAFDLEAFLKDNFAERFGRGLNTYLTTGSGVSQPTGIVTGATAGPTAVGASTNDGNASEPNTIGSDDMTALEHSVDPLYRNGAMYMFHDSTLKALKQVKDKYGRPLWAISTREGEPDTINGYRYAINNDMDALQTQASSPQVSRKTVLFGQMKKFIVRQVRQMSILRLTERFADFGQVAFIAFMRLDANLIDAGTHPVKYLTNTF